MYALNQLFPHTASHIYPTACAFTPFVASFATYIKNSGANLSEQNPGETSVLGEVMQPTVARTKNCLQFFGPLRFDGSESEFWQDKFAPEFLYKSKNNNFY